MSTSFSYRYNIRFLISILLYYYPLYPVFLLLTSKCYNRILLSCKNSRWDKSSDQCQYNTDDDQYHPTLPRKRRYTGDIDVTLYHLTDRYIDKYRHTNTYESREESYDKCLRIEHSGYILLGSTYASKNTYLLSSLKNRNVCDDSNHDG